MPVFNVEKYIDNAFNSILSQSIGFENLEVLFVDDCSTDNSAIIIKKYLNEYDNVKYICLDKNSGAAGKPRNVGIDNATADYVMFLDPDDSYMDDACEKLYDFITKNGLDVVSGNYVKDVGNELIKNSWGLIKLNGDNLKIESIKENYTLLRFPASVWAKIFRKEVIIKHDIKFPVGVPAQDLFFVSKFLINAKGIMFVDFPVVKYKPRSADEGSITSKRDKKTLAGFIKVYLDLYGLLKDFDENSKWLAAVNLYFWVKMFITCDLQISEKMDLLQYALILFEEFKNSPNLKYKKGYETFFEKVCNNDFYGAVEESNRIALVESNIAKNIKSKEILMLFFGFDINIGGLARAVFNRANVLSDGGYKVTLLNIDAFKNDNIFEFFKNFKFMENNYKKLGFLNESVTIINMFNYFSDKNTIDFNGEFISNDMGEILDKLSEKFDLLIFDLKLKDSYFIFKNYVIQRILTEDHQIIFNYYALDDFKQSIKSMYDLDSLIFLKDFSIDEKINPIKREIYINHSLTVRTDFVNEKADMFTRDGFLYCSISKLNNELFFKLNDRFSFCSFEFNYKEFYDYFVKIYCLNLDEKPFLINDCPGPRPSIANISSQLAYKIANVHCNHYNRPFNYGSPIKPLGAFENLDDLDAIIFLTDSQKKDFLKEFRFNEVYDISNFIPKHELKKSCSEKITFDKNKISVFARVSPEKNLSDIIKAFKKVHEVNSNAKLEIFGRVLRKWEVREHNRLQKLISELNLENDVVFRGHVNDVFAEMANSLVTLFVSEAEGLGLVVIESMVNCTPVIAYDLNYGPSMIITDDKDGFLVDYGNVNQLADKIIELLDNPSKAVKMGKLARQKIINKFSSDSILAKWENLFKDVYIKNEFENINYTKIFSRDGLKKEDDVELVQNCEFSQSYKSLSLKNRNLFIQNFELNFKLNNLEEKYLKLKNDLDFKESDVNNFKSMFKKLKY